MFSPRGNSYTLEFFDAHGQSYSLVDMAQRVFRNQLRENGISVVSPDSILSEKNIETDTGGLLDDSEIKTILKSINPEYSFMGIADDLSAINTVSRLRQGQKLPFVEKCKAVFITSNTALVKATSRYLKQIRVDYGFPLVITGGDLCVLAWLKDFEQDNSLPKMRLLENVLAAITPSGDLMESFYNNLDVMENMGAIASEEVALLRIDIFARKELMEITHGEKEKLTVGVIEQIREKMKADSYSAGLEQGTSLARSEYLTKLRARKNEACKRVEAMVEEQYSGKERRAVSIAKYCSVILGLIFLLASILSLGKSGFNQLSFALIVATTFTTIQGSLPFFAKDNCLIKHVRNRIRKERLIVLDKERKKLLSLLETEEEETVFGGKEQ